MKRALSMTLCLGFTLTGCASTRVSPQTEKLVADLKCEMTMGDVERLAQSAMGNAYLEARNDGHLAPI